MKVLVIYEFIPEDTITSIVEMTDDEYEFFSKAHNYYVNVGEDNEEQRFSNVVISQALATNPDHEQYCETDKEREYFGKWERMDDVTDISDVDRLIRCGFYL